MSLINLSPAFTLKLPITKVQPVGETPTGNRAYIAVSAGGTLTLPDGSVPATFLAGGDYAILGADGYGKLDVHLHAKTHDTNELLYITYSGHLEANAKTNGILGFTPGAQSTTFDDQKIFITLNVETQAAKFAWMNRTIFVGRGRFEVVGDARFVIYEVFKATA